MFQWVIYWKEVLYFFLEWYPKVNMSFRNFQIIVIIEHGDIQHKVDHKIFSFELCSQFFHWNPFLLMSLVFSSYFELFSVRSNINCWIIYNVFFVLSYLIGLRNLCLNNNQYDSDEWLLLVHFASVYKVRFVWFHLNELIPDLFIISKFTWINLLRKLLSCLVLNLWKNIFSFFILLGKVKVFLFQKSRSHNK